MLNEIDATLREAILFEALKDYEAERATSITDELIAALIALLVKEGITSFATISATRVRGFIVKMNTTLNAIFDKGDEALRERMLLVLSVALDVRKRITERLTGKQVTDAALSGSVAANTKLLAEIYAEDVPGVGASMLLMFKVFRRDVVQQMQMLVKKAFANKGATVDELLRDLKGTPARGFKDGALNKLANNMRSYIHTGMQHIGHAIRHNVDRLFYDRYQWISILDSVTTPICRSRHLKIFEYGRGPRPPAHMRCRSTTVGIMGDVSNQVPNNYYGWLRDQPPGFLSATLTPAQAEAIARGTARAADFAAYRNVKSMTPEQYRRAANAHIINPEGQNENA